MVSLKSPISSLIALLLSSLPFSFLAACQTDVGACDIDAARSPIYYDEGGFPAYPGQALAEISCGAGSFCHSDNIDLPDRFGAPLGLDFDVRIALDPNELPRLAHGRRNAWSLRQGLWAQVEGNLMPPGGAAGQTALGAVPTYRTSPGTADEHVLPSLDTAEGREVFRNWLACGAHVIEGVSGESTGVGDIVPPTAALQSCPGGEISCAGQCVLTDSNLEHCGGCGEMCGVSQSCEGGQCVCPDGLMACDGGCVDTTSDVSHCGGCASDCGARLCAGGQCVDSCPPPTLDCGGSCADLSTSQVHCGGCGAACDFGQACESGACSCGADLAACDGVCVDLQDDDAHCGDCASSCGVSEVCAGGSCTCAPETTSCGGACVDTQTDPAHCGGCDGQCDPGQGCAGGACTTCGPDVSFAADLQPILTDSCATSGCHGGARPRANLGLEAGNSYRDLVGPRASCGSLALVQPGAVAESYLMNKLLGTGMCSGSQMPKQGTSLPADQIELFRSWICRGAMDN